MFWVIGITVLTTSLILVLLQNFKTPDKVVEHRFEHHYAVSDPQFRREMSVLLAVCRTIRAEAKIWMFENRF